MVKKRDLILVGVILVIALAGLLLVRQQKKDGAVVVVSIDGQEVGRYALDKDMEMDVNQNSYDYHNHFVIENGTAFMTEADCPDGLCMAFEPISCNNEMIVCLPHRLVLTIEGGEDADVDVQAR